MPIGPQLPAMCHSQRFLALTMFEPARPCSTIAGTKLEDKDARQRRKWRRWVSLHQHETQTSLGGRTVINAVFQHKLSGQTAAGRRSNRDFRDFRFQSCAAGVARSSTGTGRMRHSTHEHGASEGYRTPAVHSRSVRDVVSFRRLDHVSQQR